MAFVSNQSALFSTTRKEAPGENLSPSHAFLVRAGYIQQISSGLYALLPLGWRVHHRLEEIVRHHMRELKAEEITLPALQPASLWEASGRLATMDPPLFRTVDRHTTELVLASTHEEAVTTVARQAINSYKDLPQAVFQIQTKFRNEARATGGLLRVREFIMKDLYSFHTTSEDLASYYEKVRSAYLEIFKACDLVVKVAAAHSGTIGGKISHEFHVAAPTGEDIVLACTQCEWASNQEASQETVCPACGSNLTKQPCIESGHIFQLGTTYSEKFDVTYMDDHGERQLVQMGCYGIGIGRLLATIAETHIDDKGLSWPVNVSPFDVHVIPVQPSAQAAAHKLAEQLSKTRDVLFDDRTVSPGQKFAEADLLGIHQRIIVSEKTLREESAEVVMRATGEATIKPLTTLYGAV